MYAIHTAHYNYKMLLQTQTNMYLYLMKQKKSPVYMFYIIVFACFLRAAVLKHFYSLRFLKRLEHYLIKSGFQVFFDRFINTKNTLLEQS